MSPRLKEIRMWYEVCVQWYDKKVVSLISSYVGREPMTEAKRWDKKEKKHVQIQRPKIVEEYNTFMGGIDLQNMCTNLYKYNIKSRIGGICIYSFIRLHLL